MMASISQALTTLLALIDSPVELDVLLLVRASPGKSFTAHAVGKELRVTTASAERELARLCGRGFIAVTLGSDLHYVYRPMTEEMDRAIAELSALWSVDRDLVAEKNRKR